jgi:hypothetical protein
MTTTQPHHVPGSLSCSTATVAAGVVAADAAVLVVSVVGESGGYVELGWGADVLRVEVEHDYGNGYYSAGPVVLHAPDDHRFPEVAVEAFDGPLGNLPTTCTVGHLR